MTESNAAPSPAARAPQQPAADSGGVKDTIESILIAFILAFVFRAFIVEAFVIPTGSMAPTLLGAHMRFTCEDCGYSFTVNYQGRSEGDDIIIPRNAGPVPVGRDQFGRPILQNRVFNLTCPNCGFHLRPEDTTNPPVHYGDRILVLKYLYLLQDPHRWDVVVFKNPDDPTKQYGTNYIKRLIGKPGEAVLILDGDVYVAPKDSSDPKDFKIQSKPRYVQEALWRVVYDNDFYPRKLDRTSRPWHQPWTPVPNGSGWDLGDTTVTGRVFHFDNLSGEGAIAFDPKANPSKHALTDWLAYDQNETVYPNNDVETWASPVSDIKLSFFYTRTEGDGPLRVTATKHETTFTAELTPTGARLLKRDAMGAEQELGNVQMSLPAGRPVHVEFTNVDHRVALRLDDKDVIVTTPEQYAPDVEQLIRDYDNGKVYPRPAIQIEAASQKAQLAHVGLWRDVHYINSRSNESLHWAIPRDFPNNVVRLSAEKGKEEFFVMGDNSIISGDARYWMRDVDLPAEDVHAQGGRVPARFMLGKAFFVYWPAGYRPFASAPGLVPNFGQMRFIH